MQTNFFDWAFSNQFDQILQVFNIKNPSQVFHKSEIVLLGGGNPHIGGAFKQIRGIEFIHDILKDGDLEEEKEKFSAQSLRRFQRLIEAVKTNKQIFFIRWEFLINKGQVTEFFETLEKIKPGNKHVLIHIPTEKGDFDFPSSYPYLNRFKYINMEEHRVKPDSEGSWGSQYDWDLVFDWINNYKI